MSTIQIIIIVIVIAVIAFIFIQNQASKNTSLVSVPTPIPNNITTLSPSYTPIPLPYNQMPTDNYQMPLDVYQMPKNNQLPTNNQIQTVNSSQNAEISTNQIQRQTNKSQTNQMQRQTGQMQMNQQRQTGQMPNNQINLQTLKDMPSSINNIILEIGENKPNEQQLERLKREVSKEIIKLGTTPKKLADEIFNVPKGNNGEQIIEEKKITLYSLMVVLFLSSDGKFFNDEIGALYGNIPNN